MKSAMHCALLTAVFVAVASPLHAGEPSGTAHASTAGVTSSELDAMHLSLIDEKLALSLAIEIHVQIELLDSAVAEVRDAQLKGLVESKRQLYRSLFSTCNEITRGRAANMLGTAKGEHSKRIADRDNGKSPGVARGMKAALQNATHAAILKARLEIAEEYVAILRDRLQAAPQDVDRQFLAADVVNQMQAVAILRVFERQASDDFAKIIRAARAAAEDHLMQDRALAARLGTPPLQTTTGKLDVAAD